MLWRGIRKQGSFMLAFLANIMARIDVCFSIIVIHLFLVPILSAIGGAGCNSVPDGHIPSAGKTHVPVVEMFDCIRVQTLI